MSSMLRAREQPNVYPSSRQVRGYPTSKSSKHTLSWQHIPSWMRDNEYIVSGYRREQGNWLGCLYSIFGYLHNETVNIHSHFWAAALFVVFILKLPSTLAQYDSTTWTDFAVFALFLSSAVFCFTCSTTFHVSTCHSEEVRARCHTFDYSGIVVLIVGSFFPCIYYGFYCEPVYQFIYLLVMSLAGVGAAYVVLHPEYAKPTHRIARTRVFIGLGLGGVVPALHSLLTHGYQKLCDEMGFNFLILSGSLYIFGAVLYANRIPERFSPGKYDHFLASHQIFHVCVVLAALSYNFCILTAFHHRHGTGGGAACST